MNVRRDLFLALTAALAACHETRTDLASGPTNAQSAPVDVEKVCHAVADENAEVLAKATRACTADSDPAGGERRLAEIAETKAFHYCHPSGNGVWVVKLTSAELQAPSGESGTWCGASAQYVITRITSDGTTKTDTRTFAAFNDDQTTLEIPYRYDYDGDGLDELLVATSHWQNGGGSSKTMEVLRAGPRGIEPYPVGHRYTNTIDADGDGRPDLIDEDFFHAVAPCGLDGIDLRGPPLLLHARADGTFSMSDEAARQWAFMQCPRSPVAPFSDPKAAACGRLWGKSIDEVSDPEIVVAVCNTPDPATVSALVSPAAPFTTLNRATPHPMPTTK